MSQPICVGDIYWVEIPKNHTVGSEQYKRRPYVVVSRDRVNAARKTIVAVPLSTQKPLQVTHPPFHIVIPANEIVPDIGWKGSPEGCIALVDQIRVVDKSRLENKLGRLSQTAQAALGLGLAYLFDLR